MRPGINKILLLGFIFLFCKNATSQDTLYLRTGPFIPCKIHHVSESEIEYRHWENLEGPFYSIKKNSVSLIKYENGLVEDFYQWGITRTADSIIFTKRNSFKTEIFSILSHKITVGYEHSFGRKWTIEQQVSIISNQILPKDEFRNYYHLKIQGVGFRTSPKFKLNSSPTPLTGNFIRFDLSYNRLSVFGLYKLSELYSYLPSNLDKGNLYVNLGGMGISFGGQYLLGQHFSLEYAMGVSCAFHNFQFIITEPNAQPYGDLTHYYNEEEFYNYVLWSFPNIMKINQFPIGLTGSFAIGYIFGEKK